MTGNLERDPSLDFGGELIELRPYTKHVEQSLAAEALAQIYFYSPTDRNFTQGWSFEELDMLSLREPAVNFMLHMKPFDNQDRFYCLRDSESRFVTVGKFVTELNQPFVGDKVEAHSGMPIVTDTNTGLGVILRERDSVFSYFDNHEEAPPWCPIDARLKELMLTDEIRRNIDGTLFVSEKNALKPPGQTF